jgi:origin recognition complex subunit 1
MARTQRDLEGWRLFIDGQESTTAEEPSRRSSRRTRQSSAHQLLTLQREHDGIEVKLGSLLLVRQHGSGEIGIVADIRFGSVNFLEVLVFWFLRLSDVDAASLPPECLSNSDPWQSREVFATEYKDEIRLAEIITSVQVVSPDELAQIDEAHRAAVYVCRRCCDEKGQRFSTQPISFPEMVDMVRRDPAEYVEFIRDETAPPTRKRAPRESPRKAKPKPNYITDLSSDEPGDSDSDVKLEATTLDDDLDDEDDYETPRKRSTPSTPTKRKRQSASPRRKNTPSSASKLHNDERKVINSMLSPLKKRLRLKGDMAKPSLSSPLPTKRPTNIRVGANGATIALSDGPLAVDSTLQIFKELKEKLHTSMRLTSLPCREDEFTSIYLNLETAIQEQTGCCVYVSGTPGVGKTATIREVIAQLKELIATNEIQDFDYVEINGLKLLTPQVAYEVLWEKVSGLNVSASNAALLLEQYFKIEEDDPTRKPLVVLMDELDQIVTKRQNVMYNFFNWPTYRYLKLIVVAVANTMDLPERVLSNKISSRLGLRRIQFIGYTFEQLGVIIKHRLDMVSRANSKRNRRVLVNEDAVSFASRKVASVSGDARRALTICRRAVEIAEAEFNLAAVAADNTDDVNVSISHISKAIGETINSPMAQFLAALPFAHKLVLVAVLLRTKRSGLAENTLGDVIDEMKNTLLIHASKTIAEDDISMVELLYGQDLDGPEGQHLGLHIRIAKFQHVVNELVENGILLQQNIKSERHRLIQLSVSDEEVLIALKRDDDVSKML